jgi:hypothetical protein
MQSGAVMGRWGDAFRAYTNTHDTADTADTNGSVQVPDRTSVNTVSSVTLIGDTEAGLLGKVSTLSTVSASGVISSNGAGPAQATAEERIIPIRDTADTADTVDFGRMAVGRDASESVNTVTSVMDLGEANGRAPPSKQVSAVSAVSRPGGAEPPGERLTILANDDRTPSSAAEYRALLEASALVALAHATARQDPVGIALVQAWFQRFNETA